MGVKREFRLIHNIKGEYAEIVIKTNHWNMIKMIQDAYDDFASKIEKYLLICKIKLDFFKKIKMRD